MLLTPVKPSTPVRAASSTPFAGATQPAHRPPPMMLASSERSFQVLQPRRTPAQLSLFAPPSALRKGG